MSIDTVVMLIQHYGYALLLPLAIIEGPIVTVIGGFLASIGALDFVLVYITVVLGDVIGDAFWYWLGRLGHGHARGFIERFFGVTEEKLARARAFMEKSPYWVFAVVKFTHGPTIPGLVAAGMSRVSYTYFFFVCLVLSVLQSAIYETVGFFFGRAYRTIDAYLTHVAQALIAVFIFVTLGLLWYSRRKRH